MRAFLYVSLVAGVCVLQATAVQAEPVDSLQGKADEEEPGRIRLPSTALQVSTSGTARLTDGGVSGALLRAMGTHSDRPSRQVHHWQRGRGRPPKSTTTDSTQVDSGGAGAGKRLLKRVALGTVMTVAAGSIGSHHIQDRSGYSDGDPIGLEGLAGIFDYGLLFGWPVGVYLADPWESSLWMTAVGHGVGWWTARKGMTAWWAIPGFAIIASELSRLVPKEMRKPLQWLFGTSTHNTGGASCVLFFTSR